MRRLDLAEVVLMLKASGIVDVVGFPWLERPDAQGLARAETLLADLGALEGRRCTITEMGRRMLQFPVHTAGPNTHNRLLPLDSSILQNPCIQTAHSG